MSSITSNLPINKSHIDQTSNRFNLEKSMNGLDLSNKIFASYKKQPENPEYTCQSLSDKFNASEKCFFDVQEFCQNIIKNIEGTVTQETLTKELGRFLSLPLDSLITDEHTKNVYKFFKNSQTDKSINTPITIENIKNQFLDEKSLRALCEATGKTCQINQSDLDLLKSIDISVQKPHQCFRHYPIIITPNGAILSPNLGRILVNTYNVSNGKKDQFQREDADTFIKRQDLAQAVSTSNAKLELSELGNGKNITFHELGSYMYVPAIEKQESKETRAKLSNLTVKPTQQYQPAQPKQPAQQYQPTPKTEQAQQPKQPAQQYQPTPKTEQAQQPKQPAPKERSRAKELSNIVRKLLPAIRTIDKHISVTNKKDPEVTNKKDPEVTNKKDPEVTNKKDPEVTNKKDPEVTNKQNPAIAINLNDKHKSKQAKETVNQSSSLPQTSPKLTTHNQQKRSNYINPHSVKTLDYLKNRTVAGVSFDLIKEDLKKLHKSVHYAWPPHFSPQGISDLNTVNQSTAFEISVTTKDCAITPKQLQEYFKDSTFIKNTTELLQMFASQANLVKHLSQSSNNSFYVTPDLRKILGFIMTLKVFLEAQKNTTSNLSNELEQLLTLANNLIIKIKNNLSAKTQKEFIDKVEDSYRIFAKSKKSN